MSETKKTIYEYMIERYERDGEDMSLWSVDNGKDTERTTVRIRDLDDSMLRETIERKHKTSYIRKARAKILTEVLLKRRTNKIKRICSNLTK